MNVIARLEYELAYYDSAVHRFNHYTTRMPPVAIEKEAFGSPSTKVTNNLHQPQKNSKTRIHNVYKQEIDKYHSDLQGIFLFGMSFFRSQNRFSKDSSESKEK